MAPLGAEAFQVTVAVPFPGVEATPVGAAGDPAITFKLSADGGPLPRELFAYTPAAYVAPLERPEKLVLRVPGESCFVVIALVPLR